MSETTTEASPRGRAGKGAATKEAPKPSYQSQFSTYEKYVPTGDEVQNPPSGNQVVQTPGPAHEGS